MSLKDNKMNTNNPRYSNEINEMSNFGVLPSKQSTPTSSSTPGPPPFNIIKTPFFDGNDAYYSLHIETLKHMNENVNSFDIDRNAEQLEGYQRDPGLYGYHNIVHQSNGSSLYSHLTLTTRTPQTPIIDMNIGLQSTATTPITPPQQIREKAINEPSTMMSGSDGQSPFEVTQPFQPSPSLLQRTMTPPIKSSMPIKPPQPIHAIHPDPIPIPIPTIHPIQEISPPNYDNNGNNNIWEHTPSWLSELNDALNRIGINAVTVIIIILAVFIAVQIRQYNIPRDSNTDNSNPPSPDTSTCEGLRSIIDDLNRSTTYRLNVVNNKIDNKTEDIMDKVDANTVNIDSNTRKTEEVQRNISNATQRIDDVEADMNNTVSPDDISDIKEFWGRQSQTNWVCAIVGKPKPFVYNDYGSLTFLQALQRGMVLAHGAMIGESENEIKQTGNTNIAHSDTPQTLNPQDCLEFATKKEDRWIEIGLTQKLIATEFEYIHIDKTKISAEDRNKSPKRFRLKGKVSGGNWTDIDVKEDKIMAINQSQIKLELMPKTGIELIRIEYDINEDAKSTRLYRFRVHGEPDIYGYNIENNQ